jgi:RES domain-containing protein
MSGARRVHDRTILDALEAHDAAAFNATIWRITRTGLDPLRGSSASGRWSPPGEFDVLYTSFTRDGSLAEIGYRLSREPVWPSHLRHQVHTIRVATKRTLRFADVASLRPLGVDAARYESFDYTATQAIAAAAHFLEFDGLIVPSARAPVSNLVLFLDQIADDAQLVLSRSASVDWNIWRKRQRTR